MGKRKRYSPKFKFQVVLEVLRNPGTGAEVARVIPYGQSSGNLIGRLRHKIKFKGDIFTTGVRWDADAES